MKSKKDLKARLKSNLAIGAVVLLLGVPLLAASGYLGIIVVGAVGAGILALWSQKRDGKKNEDDETGATLILKAIVFFGRAIYSFGAWLGSRGWRIAVAVALFMLLLLDMSWGNDGVGFPVLDLILPPVFGWPLAVAVMIGIGAWRMRSGLGTEGMIETAVRAAVPGYTRADEVRIKYSGHPLMWFTFWVPGAMTSDREDNVSTHLRQRLPAADGSTWTFEWDYRRSVCRAELIPDLATSVWHPAADGSYGNPLAPLGDPTKVPLGITYGNRQVFWDVVESAHMFIVGATGGGKSVLLNTMIEYFLLHRDDWDMYMCDLKRTEFGEFRHYPGVVKGLAMTHLQARDVICEVARVMDERQTDMDAYGAKNLAELNVKRVRRGEHPLPHVVLIMDEIGELMASVSGNSDEMKERKEARDEIASKMDSISMLGRAMGVHLVYATQRTNAEIVSMTTRMNTQTRVGLGKLDSSQSQMVFDSDIASKMRGGKGRGILYEFGGLTEFQAYRIEMSHLRQMMGVSKEDSED